MKKHTLIFASVLAVGSLALAAEPATTTNTTASAPSAAPALTDGHIVHIMETANEEEADLGKLAHSKAENKEVKDFAKKMMDEHKKSEKEIKNVAKKGNIKATDNDTSKSIENNAEMKEKALKQLKGHEFDKAYIEQQITMHQELLNDLNQKLIPAAQNSSLKSYLETTKNHVQEHLTKAQQIQTTLTK